MNDELKHPVPTAQAPCVASVLAWHPLRRPWQWMSTARISTLLLDLGLIATILAVLWTSLGLHLLQEHRRTMEQATRNASNLAGAADQVLARTIEVIDQRILFIREAYRQDRLGFNLDYLRRSSGFLDGTTLQTAIIDPSGRLRFTNLGPVVNGVDLSDRPHFRVHVNNPRDDLFISVPVLGRESGRWSIQFTRKLFEADGSFGGVVVVSMDPVWLTQLYNTLDIGRGVMTLVGLDGILRARAPHLAAALGNDLSATLREQNMVLRQSGWTRMASPLDLTDRVIAFRQITPYPLVLLVGLDMAGVYEQYNAYRRYAFLVAGALSVLVFAAGSLLLRHRRQRLASEDRTLFLAHHDALTGLANRILLRGCLNDALSTRAIAGAGLAVLTLDLDRFKAVNDAFGHAVGDHLLREVAGRLRNAVRNGDTVARVGGDEFVIIQAGTPQPGFAEDLARRLIQELSVPFQLDGYEIQVGTSVGLAVASDDGETADRVLRRSDIALYRAKAAGRGSLRCFEPAMEVESMARRRLEEDLRHAVEQNQLELHYQPVYTCRSGELVAFEALLRWTHPTRGAIAPSEFIPIAEESGLIVTIGRWAMERACRDGASWPGQVRIAVNVSPKQFRGADLPEFVAAILCRTNLPAHRLELEVTEGLLIRDTEQALGVLCALKSQGLRVALDDFGTGYSSLSYLCRFPFDRVKIDRAFISAIGSSDQAGAIVEAVLAMCSSLGLKVTAEGVETDAQLAFLRQHGCDEVQGFLLGAPRTAEAALGLLTPSFLSDHAAAGRT